MVCKEISCQPYFGYVKFNWGSGNKEFDERGTGGDSSLENLNSLPYS